MRVLFQRLLDWLFYWAYEDDRRECAKWQAFRSIRF